MKEEGPGGAREGAGRPAGAKYPHRLTVLLTDRQHAHVTGQNKWFGTTSDFIRQLIDDDIAYDAREDEAEHE